MEQLNGTNKLLICVKFCSHFQRLCKFILIIINNDVAFAICQLLLMIVVSVVIAVAVAVVVAVAVAACG